MYLLSMSTYYAVFMTFMYMHYIYCIMILRISYLSLTVGVQITRHPQLELVDVSDSVNFTCEASGTSPIYYRWLYNGNYIMDDPGHIEGVNTTILMIVNVAVTDWGVYSCEASNSFNNVTSDGATLHGVCVCVCMFVYTFRCVYVSAVCVSVSLYVHVSISVCVCFSLCVIMWCSVHMVPCSKNIASKNFLQMCYSNLSVCIYLFVCWSVDLHIRE